jgi:mannose-6-phosphate isomerase-like protein (cupin superfamily)
VDLAGGRLALYFLVMGYLMNDNETSAAVVNLRNCLEGLTEYFSPRVVGKVNGDYVKVAKLKGDFIWHKHDGEDELFFVVYGNLQIELEDRTINLAPGELFIVPKGALHKPIAQDECGIVLIEPVETLHTGDVVTGLTRSIEEQLGSA